MLGCLSRIGQVQLKPDYHRPRMVPPLKITPVQTYTSAGLPAGLVTLAVKRAASFSSHPRKPTANHAWSTIWMLLYPCASSVRTATFWLAKIPVLNQMKKTTIMRTNKLNDLYLLPYRSIVFSPQSAFFHRGIAAEINRLG